MGSSLPARFELTIHHWLNDSHVLYYVIVAILVSVQSRSGEGREKLVNERGRTGDGEEGEDTRARATETSNLSLESASAISKRDENTVREKGGRLYIVGSDI